MATRFAILGSGAWGTAVAMVLAQNPQHRVALWSARAENSGWHQRRENARLLPGVAIPESILLTTDIATALNGAELLIIGVPTVHLRGTLERITRAIPQQTPLLSLVKGLENGTFRRPTEIALEVLGPRAVAVLSGPSHAEEVARGLPTTLVAASDDLPLARWLQQCFSTERFRVYTNVDLVGVELAGALKNVIGIAAGISDGLGLGDNCKSALLTRGLAEMARFGVSLGANAQTFWGLAGMGDLITTCVSRHGRNRAVGERLGKGETLAAIQASTATVAEGVFTARSVFEKAQQMGIPMPISTEVYRVLHEQKNPPAAVNDLMVRELAANTGEGMVEYAELQAIARERQPRIALVLGYRLGDLANRLVDVAELPYGSIAGMASPSVAGHRGALLLGTWAGVPVLVFSGRLHYYEGHPWRSVALPIHIAHELGAATLIVTNAAGGIRDDLHPGDLMAIRGHLDCTRENWWREEHAACGVAEPQVAYSKRLLELLPLPTGVYAQLTGPCYETPAEIRALRTCGADAVGMSTAREIQAGHALGMECAAISCITNKAAGLGSGPIHHEEVLETGRNVKDQMTGLLCRLIQDI